MGRIHIGQSKGTKVFQPIVDVVAPILVDESIALKSKIEQLELALSEKKETFVEVIKEVPVIKEVKVIEEKIVEIIKEIPKIETKIIEIPKYIETVKDRFIEIPVEIIKEIKFVPKWIKWAFIIQTVLNVILFFK